MFYPFNGRFDFHKRRVEADITTFKDWEYGRITARVAAKRLAETNCARLLTDEEFVKLANQLGYRRD